MSRVDLKAVLDDPVRRKRLFVRMIIATQAREGIETTQEQAEAAYEEVQAEPICPICNSRMPHRGRWHKCWSTT